MMIVAANTEISAELKAIREDLRMTITGFADALGVERHTYRNWEYGKSKRIPDDVMTRARMMRARGDVGPFTIPASELLIPVPYIGYVSASDPPNWTDPFESESFEYVPPEMGDGKGKFSLRILGDSMYDLLLPDDLCVFQASAIERISCVILHRSQDNLLTVKTLRHDGEKFLLKAENIRYPEVEARGSVVGFLLGIVRVQGSRKVTVYDGNGIRP
jgi:SOS-response transcriptional repressor LexA